MPGSPEVERLVVLQYPDDQMLPQIAGVVLAALAGYHRADERVPCTGRPSTTSFEVDRHGFALLRFRKGFLIIID